MRLVNNVVSQTKTLPSWAPEEVSQLLQKFSDFYFFDSIGMCKLRFKEMLNYDTKQCYLKTVSPLQIPEVKSSKLCHFWKCEHQLFFFHNSDSPPNASNHLLTFASHMIHFYQHPWNDELWTGGGMPPTQSAKGDVVHSKKKLSKHILNEQQMQMSCKPTHRARTARNS